MRRTAVVITMLLAVSALLASSSAAQAEYYSCFIRNQCTAELGCESTGLPIYNGCEVYCSSGGHAECFNIP